MFGLGNSSGKSLTSAPGAAHAQAQKHARPLVWIGTAAEVIAASGALFSKLPSWMASSLIVGIPLLSLSIYQWRKADFLGKQVKQLYHYDRKYTVSISRWTMRESEVQGYWAGVHHGEREMIALAPIGKWTWNISRRADDDLPFYNHPPTLMNLRATRSGVGNCSFMEPHRQGANLTFRIEFDPMLRVGETVSISFDIDVPVYKPATLEGLRRRPAPAIAAPGEVEFSSIDIVYPVDKFISEIVIPESLGSRRHGVQVLLRDNEFSEEASFLRDKNAFVVDRSSVDNMPVWILRVERDNPPIKASYRIYWEPPKRG
jgi:hypothetical protein